MIYAPKGAQMLTVSLYHHIRYNMEEDKLEQFEDEEEQIDEARSARQLQ